MSAHVMKLLNLSGKTALITGGSRGLGLQLAESLGEAGARIVITSRKAPGLEAAAAALTSRGIDAQWIAGDAARPDQVEYVCTEALNRLKQIDILVNNAGTPWAAPAESHSIEAWDKVMNLNIRSAFLFSQAIGRASMIPNKHGRIINVASIAGLGGNPAGIECVAYNTSKGALVNFTRALAAEWGEHGITVNAIAPGLFPSKMGDGLLEKLGMDNVVAQTPLGRIGDEDDLKGLALLLASSAGKHITGQIIPVDGGMSCAMG